MEIRSFHSPTLWDAIKLYSKRINLAQFPFVWDEGFLLHNSRWKVGNLGWYTMNVAGVFLKGILLPGGLLARQIFLQKMEINLLIVVVYAMSISYCSYTLAQIVTKTLYGEDFVFGVNQFILIRNELFKSEFKITISIQILFRNYSGFK